MKFFLWLSCILNLVLVGYLINRPVQYIQTDYNFIHKMDTLNEARVVREERGGDRVRGRWVKGFPVPFIIGPVTKTGSSITIPILFDTVRTTITYTEK